MDVAPGYFQNQRRRIAGQRGNDHPLGVGEEALNRGGDFRTCRLELLTLCRLEADQAQPAGVKRKIGAPGRVLIRAQNVRQEHRVLLPA
jgi:hypothetical protein